jgi:HSP20 family protein
MLPVLRNGSPRSVFPTAPFNRLEGVFDRMFGDDGAFPVSTQVWAGVPVALWHDDDHVWVEVEMPGVNEKDVELTVHQGTLYIRGERASEEGRKYLFNNRTYGRFERILRLPEGIDTENVEAKLTNGVLQVAFSKRAEAKPRKITLQSN